MYVNNLGKLKLILEVLMRIPSNTSIGIHGISSECTKELCDSILSHGVKTSGWGGVLSNFEMLGSMGEIDDKKCKKIMDYTYFIDSNNCCATVIAAIPEKIKDSDSREYFIGKFPENNEFGYAKGKVNMGANLPINKYVESKNVIPSEFIVGVLVTNLETQESYFYSNNNYIGIKSLDERSKYFDEIKQDLIKFGAVDIENIESAIELFKRFNISGLDLFINQLMELNSNKKIK